YRFTVHVFPFHDIKQLAQGFGGVRDQREGQCLLFGEVGMRFQRIAGYTDDLAASIHKILIVVAKALCLGCAAWSTVFGIKIQDSKMTPERVQTDFTLGTSSGEGGGRPANYDFAHAVSLRGNRAAMTRRPSAIRIL